MSRSPLIHSRRVSFSASKAREQLAKDLSTIRDEDDLTDADVGRVLGKSGDQAEKYRKDGAEMSFTTFLLGLREWNGRLGNGVLAMIGMKLVDMGAEVATDSERLCRILRLAHLLSVALNDDKTPDFVDEDELKDIGTDTLDAASRAIDALRVRLTAITEPPSAERRMAAVK